MRGTVPFSSTNDSEDLNRTYLTVHVTRPPFLDDASSFRKGGGTVATVKDVTSDLRFCAYGQGG